MFAGTFAEAQFAEAQFAEAQFAELMFATKLVVAAEVTLRIEAGAEWVACREKGVACTAGMKAQGPDLLAIGYTLRTLIRLIHRLDYCHKYWRLCAPISLALVSFAVF